MLPMQDSPNKNAPSTRAYKVRFQELVHELVHEKNDIQSDRDILLGSMGSPIRRVLEVLHLIFRPKVFGIGRYPRNQLPNQTWYQPCKVPQVRQTKYLVLPISQP